ncbi:hypothetical protein [Methylobacterium sp. R2-1]|uniref:hypothetical protein n=1 Tax=Methylobacterium sp. R2-1 TaxID=2587064 RepID=UPI00161F4B1C|nr:hypothetical protein [Methylobacterium sp. R2-1]MBB2959861.1 uncharacterized protein (DUF169 family) [Methylobacterium sp. R2-1]
MAKSYAAEGNRNTAIRILNAYANFAETLVAAAGITSAQADAVARFYVKNKIAKVDPVIGRISVKHGAYLDREVILRAAAAA